MARFYDANPAAGGIIGRKREEILPEERQGPIDASDSATGGSGGGTVTHGQSSRTAQSAPQRRNPFFRSRSRRWFSQSPAGEPGTCMIIRDITERKGDRGRTRTLDPGAKRNAGPRKVSERIAAQVRILPKRSMIKRGLARPGDSTSGTTRKRTSVTAFARIAGGKLYPETIRR